MSLSKCKLSAGMKRTCLSLDDKIKVLDYKPDHRTIGIRQLGDKFNIGITSAANILKNTKHLRKDY